MRARESRLPVVAGEWKIGLGALVLTAFLFWATPVASAAAFQVTNSNDSGPGSLRQAILDANDSVGVDTITFAIPGPGPHTISPATALPQITDPVVIDGTTEPDFAGSPVIELDGSATNATGLLIRAGGSTVRGLVINRWSYGIQLFTGGGNTIEGNLIGTDVTGTIDRGNIAIGIQVSSPGNTIGGATAATRNLISGNQSAIDIRGPDADGNRVVGNWIGTDVTGTLKVPDSPNNEGQFSGVTILFSSGNVIGGTAPGEGNVLAGGQYGVYIEGVDGFPATANVVQGNFIGTDASATLNLGNFSSGVLIFNSGGNTIGGTSPGARNVIAHNGFFAGVNVQAGEGGPPATGNAILGNSILANHFPDSEPQSVLGIDLGFDGVTANDPGDADTGANDLQNFPVLTGASAGGGSATITGTLSSRAATSYRVELFSNAACDPSGNGEGERFLGAVTVTTDDNLDGSGDASFTFAGAAIGAGSYVTATATDPAGSTSEFSLCAPVTGGNQAPTCSNGGFSMPEDSGIGFTVSCSDPENDALTYSIVTPPSHGTATTTGANDFNYTPAFNYYGPDSFTFRANDGALDSNTATVSFNVSPIADLPSFTLPTRVNASEFEGLLNDFFFSFSDPDGQPSSAFIVDVQWGDGTTSHLTSAADWWGPGSTTYDLNVSHLYKRFGVYSVRIALTDINAGTVTRTTTIVVKDAPIFVGSTGQGFARRGQTWSVRITCFEDENPYSVISDFTATVKWGDGTSSTARVKLGTQKDPNGADCRGWDYGVHGSHIYTKTGTFKITITVLSVGGSSGTGKSSVRVVA